MALRLQPPQVVSEPAESHSICAELSSNDKPAFAESTAWYFSGWASAGGKGELEPATCVVAVCGVAGLTELLVLLPDFDWLQLNLFNGHPVIVELETSSAS